MLYRMHARRPTGKEHKQQEHTQFHSSSYEETYLFTAQSLTRCNFSPALSPLICDIHSYSVTPPPEESSQCQSPTESLPELPPIDYEDRTGNAVPSKPAQVNGIDHRKSN